MTTSVNLSSEERVAGRPISGKPVLILSVLILIVTILAYFTVYFMKNRYVSQKNQIDVEITGEQNKMKGPEFADIVDFQEKLTVLDKVADDHAYWSNHFRELSRYFIPEVRLEKMSGQKDPESGGIITLNGIAPNLDAVSKELILLKNYPNLESLEFKEATERTGTGENESSGISFSATLNIKKSAFQK